MKKNFLLFFILVIFLIHSSVEANQNEASKIIKRQQTTQRFAQYMEETAPWNIMYKELQKPLRHFQKSFYQFLGVPYQDPFPDPAPTWQDSKRQTERELLNKMLNPPTKKRQPATPSSTAHNKGFQTKRDESSQKKQVNNKRSLATERAFSSDTVCGDFGRYTVGITPRDVCMGRTCTVNQINCNGTLIDMPSFRNDPSIPQDCFVTEMDCANANVTTGLVNFGDRFGLSQCSIERLECDNLVIIPPAIYTGFQLATCDATIQCEDFRTFGSSFYGFQCSEQTLECSGSPIDPSSIDPTNTTFLDSLPSCSIDKQQCDIGLDLTATTCSQYSISCNGTTNAETGCSVFHRPIECDTGDERPGCIVADTLECDGATFDAATYSGPLEGCMAANFSCSNSDVMLEQPCEIEQAICNGIIVDLRAYNGELNNCEITRVSCLPAGMMTGCTEEQFVCDLGSQCNLVFEQFPCQSDTTCVNQNLNDTRCLCPWDFMGPFCEEARDLQCQTTLISPEMNCDHPINNLGEDPRNQLLDRDPACLVFDIAETPSLQWNFTCQWANPDEVDTDEVLAQNFTYDIINDRFALSEPQEWIIYYKVYNFNRFSDDGMRLNLTMTRSQQLADEPLIFTLPMPLSQVDRRYVHGNRIYTELFFLSSEDHSPQGADLHYDNKFLDSPGFNYRGSNSTSTLTTGEIALIIVSVLVFVIIIFLIIKRNYKRWWDYAKGDL